MLHFLLLAMQAQLTLARPNGAPTAACDHMTPPHGGNAPQPMETNPYNLEFRRSGGGSLYQYSVTLTSKSGMGEMFKGFLVQARREHSSEVVQLGEAVSKLVLNLKSSSWGEKMFNFITRLYSIDLFTVFGKLFWDLFHREIKSCFPGNKVAYVLKFGECGKRQFLIKFEFKHF